MTLAFLRTALPTFAIAALAAPAAADSLAVTVAPDVALPAEVVSAAITAELELDGDGADLGMIDIALDDTRQLLVVHRRPDGTALARTVALPALPADRLALIAFITGNLVRDQLAGLDTAVAPPAAVAPQVEAPALPPPAPVEQAERDVPVSIGFVPPLSSDRLWTSRARVRGNLSVIAGGASSVDGISISGVADLTGNVRGLQIGGAVTYTRHLRGAQFAGAAAYADDVHGLQAGGAIVVGTHVRGAQLGGGGTFARYLYGMQAAGGVAVTKRTRGIQIAGGAAISERVDGVQLAPINIARRVDGLQLGVINFDDSGEAVQIGVLNFARRGRTDLDAWLETTGVGALALRHGGRHTHTIYALGMAKDGGDTPLLGFGFGVRRRLGEATLDLDALAWQTHMFQDGLGLLSQARATVAIDIGPIAAFAAAAYNVSIEDQGEERPVTTMLARSLGEPMSDYDVALWPSFSVGVRGHLGAMR